jgi:histidinol-phosphate phosphatase family protein
MPMIVIKQAVILAGGLGTRLRPYTISNPKPMVRVLNRPFLEHLINLLKKNGITEVVIMSGYLHEKITEYFGDGSNFGIQIQYSIGPVENKTGTRIRNAKDLLDEHFLLMYSDNYWPLNLKKHMEFYNLEPSLGMVTAYTNNDAITLNNMLVAEDGHVQAYDKTRIRTDLNSVEIGFYILDKDIINLMPEYNFSFEEEIIPQLILKNQLRGFLTDNRYYSISTPKKLEDAQRFFKPKKIIFLDRDGVINKKPPKADYVKKWEEFEFIPGSIDCIKKLYDSGYELIIITNQPGIARGLMTEKTLTAIHKKMIKKFSEVNVEIKDIYYCPHGWNDGCNCRKPKPGMLYQASFDYHIDLTDSILIGDDERDIQAGEAVGCTSFLIENDNFLSVVNNILTNNEV